MGNGVAGSRGKRTVAPVSETLCVETANAMLFQAVALVTREMIDRREVLRLSWHEVPEDVKTWDFTESLALHVRGVLPTSRHAVCAALAPGELETLYEDDEHLEDGSGDALTVAGRCLHMLLPGQMEHVKQKLGSLRSTTVSFPGLSGSSRVG